MRADGRLNSALRPLRLVPGYLGFAEGSVLVEWGKNVVLCAATVQESVPPWLAGQGRGWVSGEYAMLPRATLTRTPREGVPSGRTHEIRRLIGRSLRASVNLNALGERRILIDCDVIQADGGTRTASVTGGYVALALAIRRLIDQGLVTPDVLASPVAALSVGVVDGQVLADLDYSEDSRAEVDLNVVMNAEGEYIEVQGTAEGQPFPRARLDELLDIASSGIADLLVCQRQALCVT